MEPKNYACYDENKELYGIYHGFDEDGGYGDAIYEEVLVGVVQATETEIREFVEKYDKPIVYGHPYDDLTAHHIRAEKITITDICKVKPYGDDDYYSQLAEEYELAKKYNQEYGERWRYSERRDEIYDKWFFDLEEIRKKYNPETDEEEEQK